MKRTDEQCNLTGVHMTELHMKFSGDNIQASAHAIYSLISDVVPVGSCEMVGPWPPEIFEQINNLRNDIEQHLLKIHFGTQQEEDNESESTGEFGSILSSRLGKTTTEIGQI